MRSVGSEDRVAGVAKGFEARVVRVFVEEFVISVECYTFKPLNLYMLIP
jgi:hypothetical protein